MSDLIRTLYYTATGLKARRAGISIGKQVWLSTPGKYRIHASAQVVIEDEVHVADNHRFEAHPEAQIRIGPKVHFADNVRLLALKGAQIVIEEGCFFNHNVSIVAANQIIIKKNTILGPFCYIIDLNHGTSKGELIKIQPHVAAPLLIGCDVWVGVGAAILKGAEVGDGAVIAAHAVVNKLIPPYEIWGGVPARHIGQRL